MEISAQRGTVMGPRSLGLFVRLGCTQVSPSALPLQSILWPCLPSDWARQLTTAFALSRREFCCVNPAVATEKAGKCWLVGMQGGRQTLLTFGMALLSPLPCTVVNKQKCEGRRKPLLKRALTQRVLYLAAASSRNPPSPGKDRFSIRIRVLGKDGNIELQPGHWGEPAVRPRAYPHGSWPQLPHL